MVRLHTQVLDFVLVDKDCECIVSTQSVKIALISHNLLMMVLSQKLLKNCKVNNLKLSQELLNICIV